MPTWYSVTSFPTSWSGSPGNWKQSFVPGHVSFPAISPFRDGGILKCCILTPLSMETRFIATSFRKPANLRAHYNNYHADIMDMTPCVYIGTSGWNYKHRRDIF
jgi:hypothetical protein